jgi:hypothetical protein
MMILTIFAAWIGASVQAMTLQPPGPVVTQKTFSEYPGPPSTLTGMIAAADAVVRGRIAGRAPFLEGDRPQPLRSIYRVQVVEVFHGTAAGPSTGLAIEVARVGGFVDHPDRTDHFVDTGFPDFESGREYVIFLDRSTRGDYWYPAFGPDSVFAIHDRLVEPLGRASVSRAQDGADVVTFLDAVRRYGQSRTPR